MGVGYNPRIITDGLVLCLDAGNTKSYPGSGTAWNDLSSSKNNVTLVNGPAYSTSYITFDGTNDYASLTSTIDAEATTLFSSFAWVYRTDSLTLDAIIGSTGKVSALALTTDGRLRFLTSTATFFIESEASSIVNSTWYHVGVTRGALDRIYINGIEVASGTISQGRAFGGVDVIGKTTTTNYFSGRISHLVAYKKELSASEVQQNFNALRGRYGI